MKLKNTLGLAIAGLHRWVDRSTGLNVHGERLVVGGFTIRDVVFDGVENPQASAAVLRRGEFPVVSAKTPATKSMLA